MVHFIDVLRTGIFWVIVYNIKDVEKLVSAEDFSKPLQHLDTGQNKCLQVCGIEHVTLLKKSRGHLFVVDFITKT